MYSNAGWSFAISSRKSSLLCIVHCTIEDRGTVRYAGIFVFWRSGFVFKNPTAHKPEKGNEVKDRGLFARRV